jgi:hypothetical protein
MKATSMNPIRVALAVAVIPALLFIGSCSKDVSPLCQDAQNLKDSVQALTEVDLQSGGADALTTAVDNVKSSVDGLGTEAKSTFGPQVSTIQTQLTALSSAADQVQGGASVASVAPDVAASLSTLKTALTQLQSTAQAQDCNLT